jgi:MarR family transcriptional regulator for hemolysin
MDIGEGFSVELGRISRRWRARLDERLRQTGLTQARWVVLLQLSRVGPVAQRELAERLGIEGPTLVRVLDNLEKQGLVERRPCDGDKRVKEIHLTDAARPLIEKIARISAELRGQVLADIPDEELRGALAVLRVIGERLEGM